MEVSKGAKRGGVKEGVARSGAVKSVLLEGERSGERREGQRILQIFSESSKTAFFAEKIAREF